VISVAVKQFMSLNIVSSTMTVAVQLVVRSHLNINKPNINRYQDRYQDRRQDRCQDRCQDRRQVLLVIDPQIAEVM